MTTPFTLTSRISKKEFAWISIQKPTWENAIVYLLLFHAIYVLIDPTITSHGIKSFGPGYWGWMTLSWIIVLFVVLIAQYFRYLRDYNFEYPIPGEGYVFEFYPDRFVAKSGDFRSEIGWREVKKLVRIRQILILRMGKGRVTYYLDIRQLTAIQQEFIMNAFRNSRTKR